MLRIKIIVCLSIFVFLIGLGAVTNNHLEQQKRYTVTSPSETMPTSTLYQASFWKNGDFPPLPFQPREYVRIQRTANRDY
ncbi:hypothetical protein [Paenibacillus sp. KS-LC4]|uniref:hypothetical protein n=1 Tax=Paenibacillus sp. KS-LC4 TaxID=2979727 RepID=UPI0030D24E5A